MRKKGKQAVHDLSFPLHIQPEQKHSATCTAVWDPLYGHRQIWSLAHGLAGCGTGKFNKLISYPLQWNTVFEYEMELTDNHLAFLKM